MDVTKYIGRTWNHPIFNCFSLVAEVLHNEFNIDTPLYEYTGDVKKADKLFMESLPEWMEVDAPSAGCMVVFNLQGKPLHCGVMIDSNRMLHCLKGRETCVESIHSATWAKRVEGFYQWRS